MVPARPARRRQFAAAGARRHPAPGSSRLPRMSLSRPRRCCPGSRTPRCATWRSSWRRPKGPASPAGASTRHRSTPRSACSSVGPSAIPGDQARAGRHARRRRAVCRRGVGCRGGVERGLPRRGARVERGGGRSAECRRGGALCQAVRADSRWHRLHLGARCPLLSEAGHGHPPTSRRRPEPRGECGRSRVGRKPSQCLR